MKQTWSNWWCKTSIYSFQILNSFLTQFYLYIKYHRNEPLTLAISVQFSCSVVSNSLQPHESQHARPPCLSPTPRVHSNLCPSVGDAIQQSHSLLSPFPPALDLSQHQSLSKWVSSLHQVAKVLEFQLQHQSFQWTPGLISFRTDWLDLLAVQGTLKVFSNTTVQKHQFFGDQLSSQFNSHIHTWPLETP